MFLGNCCWTAKVIAVVGRDLTFLVKGINAQRGNAHLSLASNDG